MTLAFAPAALAQPDQSNTSTQSNSVNVGDNNKDAKIPQRNESTQRNERRGDGVGGQSKSSPIQWREWWERQLGVQVDQSNSRDPDSQEEPTLEPTPGSASGQ